jgi:hypothetical protein
MERAVGFRRGSFSAALIVSTDGRATAGPPASMSWDLCHFSRPLGLTRPVHGVPGPPRRAAFVIARRPGARYREIIWPRS